MKTVITKHINDGLVEAITVEEKKIPNGFDEL
jgi:hypothetical protein